MKRIEIDWSKCILDIRRHYKIYKIANTVGCGYRQLQEMARGEIQEPRFTVGMNLLKLHQELEPDRHAALFNTQNKKTRVELNNLKNVFDSRKAERASGSAILPKHWHNPGGSPVGIRPTLLNAIPKDAPNVQIRMMKHAFYSGALNVLNIQMEISKDNISEDAAVQVLEGLHREIADHFMDVIKQINKTTSVGMSEQSRGRKDG